MGSSGFALVNGRFSDEVSASNRGIAYGDGVFETVLVRGSQTLWLDEHLCRLQSGAKILNIPCDIAAIKHDCLRILAAFDEPLGVLKIILTRGTTARGYTPLKAESDRIVSVSSYKQHREMWDEGVVLAVCQTPLARQALLAGIKHLNRLEQVLAAEELHKRGYQEGLMMQAGCVIECSRSNVFAVVSGELITPSLSLCGINGIMRSKILSDTKSLGLPVRVKAFGISALVRAEEVFICNSVFGIWPVTKIECMHKEIGPMSRLFQQEYERYFYA